MMQEPPPLVLCPRCTFPYLAGPGGCPRCGASATPFPNSYAWSTGRAAPPFLEGIRLWRWRRRTRIGLALSSVGLVLLWLPWVSAAAAILLSLGSTLVFLGARAHGRDHQVAVAYSFVAFVLGGVVIATFFGIFLADAYDASRHGLGMVALSDTASLLLWGTFPGTLAVAAALILQVNHLLPPRRRMLLYLLAGLLVATALAATWLAEPALAVLGPARVRAALVVDFLWRISVPRVVEGPACVGLGILYLLASRGTQGATPRPPRSSAGSFQ